MRLFALATVVLLSLVPWVSVRAANEDDATFDARAPVKQAMRQAGSIEAQAAALADLAWPIEPDTVDPRVRAAARRELVGFGVHGAPAIREVIRSRPAASADAVAAIVEVRTDMQASLPPNYLETLDEALWFGSSEARLIAMQELGVLTRALNYLAIVDAAEEDPSLIGPAMSTLARMREPRSRFWLASFLNDDDRERRREAAATLAAIGGDALEPLKDGLASRDAELRALCARAIVPVARSTELTALYEYLDAFPDDDPEVVEAVRERALAIERAIDEWNDEQFEDPAGRPSR